MKRKKVYPSDAPEVIAPELAGKNELPVRAADDGSRPVTRYKFRFSALTRAVLFAGLFLCVAAIALTTWQLFDLLRTGTNTSALEWLKLGLMYLVSGALGALIVAVLLRSEYQLGGRNLTLVFGFIRTRYPLAAIRSVHLFKGAKKLVVYFEDEKNKYMAIVIRESLYETFVKDLLSRNERIVFTFSTAEEEDELKKKK